MEEWGWFDSESSKGGVGEEVRNGNAENREERERERAVRAEDLRAVRAERRKGMRANSADIGTQIFYFFHKGICFFFIIFLPLYKMTKISIIS